MKSPKTANSEPYEQTINVRVPRPPKYPLYDLPGIGMATPPPAPVDSVAGQMQSAYNQESFNNHYQEDLINNPNLKNGHSKDTLREVEAYAPVSHRGRHRNGGYVVFFGVFGVLMVYGLNL